MPKVESIGSWMPLTLPQLDFWEEFSFYPDKPVSTVAHLLEIEGEVEKDKLIQAVSKTILESEVLSIRFSDERGASFPMQLCDPMRTPEVNYVDLCKMPDPCISAEKLIKADLDFPLDLRKDKLSAHSIYRVRKQKYLWYIRAHHIIIDGYGMALIEQRCGQLYNHLCGKIESGHPFYSFASFINEEEVYQASQQWKKDRNFWHNYIDGSFKLNVLDRGSENYGDLGHHRHIVFPCSFSKKLQDMATTANVGWPDLLILLTGLYLSRKLPERSRDGCAGLTLWLPLMGRWGSVGAHMPGLLVNILPFYLTFYPAETFSSGLQRNADTLKKHRKHGRYRIEQIASDFGIANGKRFSFSPLINILPFTLPQFMDCQVKRKVLASGPGDGFNLSYRSESDRGTLTLDIDAELKMMDERTFTHITDNLLAFLNWGLDTNILSKLLSEIWNRLL